MSTIPVKTDNAGQFFTAAEYNAVTGQIQSVETDAGGVNIPNDINQFRQGIASYAAISNFYTCTGVANSYVLNPQGSFKTPIDAPSAWNGMLIRFRPVAENTGASTISFAGLNGGAPINIITETNTPLIGGELKTDRDAFGRYNISQTSFILLGSSLQTNINNIENSLTSKLNDINPILKRQNTVNEGGQISFQQPDNDNLTYIDLLKSGTNYRHRFVSNINGATQEAFTLEYNSSGILQNIFTALPRDFTVLSGYTYTLDGLLMQWRRITVGDITGTDFTQTYTFPVAFPNACFGVTATFTANAVNTGNNDQACIVINALTNSQFIAQIGIANIVQSADFGFFMMAIGY